MKIRLAPTLEFVVELSDKDAPHLNEIRDAMKNAAVSRGMTSEVTGSRDPITNLLNLRVRITLSGAPPEEAIRLLVNDYLLAVLPRFRELRRELRKRAAAPVVIPDRKLTPDELREAWPELMYPGAEWEVQPPTKLHKLLMVGDFALAHAHVDSLERIARVTDAVIRNGDAEIILNLEPRGGRAQAIVLKKIETLPKPIAPSKKA